MGEISKIDDLQQLTGPSCVAPTSGEADAHQGLSFGSSVWTDDGQKEDGLFSMVQFSAN